eukprot:UN34019
MIIFLDSSNFFRVRLCLSISSCKSNFNFLFMLFQFIIISMQTANVFWIFVHVTRYRGTIISGISFITSISISITGNIFTRGYFSLTYVLVGLLIFRQ